MLKLKLTLKTLTQYSELWNIVQPKIIEKLECVFVFLILAEFESHVIRVSNLYIHGDNIIIKYLFNGVSL